MTHPMNYKTLDGLQRAIKRQRHKSVTVKSSWWYYNAQYALVKNFGWTEEDAACYIAMWKSRIPGYKG